MVILAFTGVSLAGNKHAPDLNADPNATVDVIIQFKTPPTNKELKADWHTWQVEKAVPPRYCGECGNTPDNRGQPGRRSQRHLHLTQPKTTGSLDIVTATVNAPYAWQYGWDGTGVGVAVIDSGITPKDDLMAADGRDVPHRVQRKLHRCPGYDGRLWPRNACCRHRWRQWNGFERVGFKRTYRGVAPNVNLINLRVLDQNGAGQEANVIAAIDRAIQLQSTYNIRVINLSLGHPVYESYTLDPLCQAVEAAWKAGIVVVSAAGNYGRDNSYNTHGYGTIASPGNDPYVITVGATKTNGTPSRLDDSIASYSSKGAYAIDHIVKPDLVAPGNNVVSLLSSPNCTIVLNEPKTQVSPTTYETVGAYSTTSNYLRLSGTSMATPVVSGAAALLIQQQPFLTPDQVKARLMKTAGKILPRNSTGIDILSLQTFTSQGDIFTHGAGYLDIRRP